MDTQSVTENMYDPRIGGQAIRVESLPASGEPFEPARTNCFSVYLIDFGKGSFWADASQFPFNPDCLLFFVPYQHIRLVGDGPVTLGIKRIYASIWKN